MPGNAAAQFTLFAVAGGGFGAFTSTVNVSGIPVVPQIIGVGWSWAVVGIASAAIAFKQPTLTVLVVLVAAVAGYYISDLRLGVYNVIDFSTSQATSDPTNAPQVTLWGGALTDFGTWSLCAAVVSWPLARIGVAIHRNDWWGLAARPTVPLGSAIEVLTFRLPSELAIQPRSVIVATYVTVASLSIPVTALL
jgi:hypothetical protein